MRVLTRARSLCYTVARGLGDLQAIRRGRIWQRIANRLIARAMFRLVRPLWR